MLARIDAAEREAAEAAEYAARRREQLLVIKKLPPGRPPKQGEEDLTQPTAPPSCWPGALAHIVILALTFAFLMLFSHQGYGQEVITRLSAEMGVVHIAGVKLTLAKSCVGWTAMLLVLMYLFDFEAWTGWSGTLMRRVMLLLVLSGGLLACIFTASEFPELPMAVYLLLIPVAALSLRMSVLDGLSNEGAMKCLGSALLTSSLAALLVWCYWVGTGHAWTDANKARWSARLACVDRADMQQGGEYTICRSVFVLWVSPLIVSAINGLLAAVLYALGSSFQRVKPWKLLQLQRHKLGAAGRKLGAGGLVSSVLGDMKLRQEKQRRAKHPTAS